MNYRSQLLLYLTFLMGLFSNYGIAQDQSCSQVLKKAESTYDQGRLFEVEEMLQPCLESGFTKDERVAAYKLLSLTYLYFNEKEKAEEAMNNFLKNNPEYEINPSIDPAEFINLYNNFRTTPAWLIGFKGGGNRVDIDVDRNFSLDDAREPKWKYESLTGFQAGLMFEKPLSKHLSVLGEVLYIRESYHFTDSLFDYAYLNYQEDISRIQVPLIFSIQLGKSKKVVPYFNVGGSAIYLLSAEALVNRKDNTGEGSQREVRDRRIDISDQRNTITFNLLASAGIKIKDIIGRGFIFFDLRYSRGLQNLINPDSRYSNHELVYDFLYLDNDVKIHSYQLSLGYSLPIYKPKLKRTNNRNDF